MVAIFGRSGCGKTTLLNVLGGLDSFGSGSIEIDGKSITEDTDTLRNKYIGYIFQNYNLNHAESCFENVADALRLCGVEDGEIIKRRVMAALKNVGLEDYHSRTPDTLSGGQQQRIAIARAIVKNPKIILADEPTGNLDDANTVLIMDLLKEISRDHLVLLVTHEANLVDFYCDKVIELCDGEVVGVRENDTSVGYSERGKNDIYLGELRRSVTEENGVSVELYGEEPDGKLSLTVVNNGGKLYLRINTPKVQILDASSEVKLHEGVYEKKQSDEHRRSRIDMSELSPIEGERVGRLFDAKGAVKSGYKANFRKGKKSKNLLRRCLCLFAAVIVIMSGVFGLSFKTLSDADSAYNHNVFYVYTEDGKVSERLQAAMADSTSGIDYIRLDYNNPTGDTGLRFSPGHFETFDTSSNFDAFGTNGVFLDVALADGLELMAGRMTELEDNEIVISTRLADDLIENSSLGYIDSYDDIIGMLMWRGSSNVITMRVAGVVKTGESAVYMSSIALADRVLSMSGVNVELAWKKGFDIPDGTAVYATRDNTSKDLPKVGDTVKIQGKDIEISRAIIYAEDYAKWLKNNGISKTLPSGNANYFDQCDEYFDRFDEYLGERMIFASGDDFFLWLYTEKEIEAGRYALMTTASVSGYEYMLAAEYKAEHGSYPTRSYIRDLAQDDGVGDGYFAEKYEKIYSEEFYRSDFGENYFTNKYLVSEGDYVDFSRYCGENHKTVADGTAMKDNYYYEEVYYDGVEIYQEDIAYIGGGRVYSVIHSNDPDATEEYLARNFSDITLNDEYYQPILTPDMIYERLISSSYENIMASIVAMIVILVVMSICVYFIMRSSLLNRIKEVGIYRAIGVTKKNLVFKFFVEAVVLTTLTVFVGYICTSAFLFACLGMSSFMESMLYYPLWLAGIVLAVLYAVCLFFGTLPTVSLLRKTPSEILSKYDI